MIVLSAQIELEEVMDQNVQLQFEVITAQNRARFGIWKKSDK